MSDGISDGYRMEDELRAEVLKEWKEKGYTEVEIRNPRLHNMLVKHGYLHRDLPRRRR